AENEIKNYLAGFWILNNGEIDGWIGRLAFVEHAYLGSHRVVDIDSPYSCFDQQHLLEAFARLTLRQIFLLVIVRRRVRTPRQTIAFTVELDCIRKRKTIDRRTFRTRDPDMSKKRARAAKKHDELAPSHCLPPCHVCHQPGVIRSSCRQSTAAMSVF